MREYLYYPGCSLKGVGGPYEQSLLASFEKLGVKLTEIPDWNCCGATAYMSVDANMAIALAARNLAIAEKNDGQDIIAPCSGCYLSLTKAKAMMEQYPELRTKVSSALGQAGLTYAGRSKVRHPLEVLMTDIGTDGLKKAVNRPLKNLRVVPYYGCAILRPFKTVGDPHTPTVLEEMINIAGATPVDYPYKGRCCGGMLTSGVQTVGLRLAEILLEAAKGSQADVIVTTCPLCNYNLECYQDKLRKSTGRDLGMPVMYFTQILGLAIGLSDGEVGMNRLLQKPTIMEAIA
ncbi:MAG: CoB--CoM heterodisulfide reductase iron-sulfur subunit B family protein [Methanomassiliicoccales archaeon]|nr:CoB--CoM heterodisulfide reductase iron-sulfur subunit B family protein [Methanomassiliicoccales archaeon]